ncbi:MAG: NPCBM/NEW2 domain-containing protein, partial [Thomasclavelia sp.]|uniref:NPCBM/NEW2 domain-containing protein n=1 Tax=Thomasclavelia sp. TaxID=3025757 RepID=UPI0039A0AA12
MKLKKRIKSMFIFSLVICMLFCQGMPLKAVNIQNDGIHINVLDYGADPTGVKDSTTAIWDALQAAKEAEDDGKNQVILDFPKGEYHIYKDYAQVREYHTSNTNSIQSPEKTIGILIEGHKNLTINGNDSLFMMHGNIMALAVVESQNIVLQDFSWDFAVPTVSEMTIMEMGNENGKDYTDFYIPKCFPFEIAGNTIKWYSEKSPYTGEYYWSETGIHNAYSIVGYLPEEEMTRAYFTNETPFQNVSSITKLDDTVVRITYTGNNRPAMQKAGMVLELASSAYRETAGAFTWESKNVVANRINVHFMHGFGWLIQMSEDVAYYDCNFMPRENSGHITVSYADIIHASGAAGEIIIENCNFSNSHDDPINLHGTFTRVEKRKDDHTLQLKYIHTQQGGFPQYHVGDKVAFFTRDTLESTDNENLYTVKEVISNPGENGNDLRTMEVSFEESLPANLTDKIGNEPKYVAENVTYAPAVTIRNNTFKNVPTRGILCTTRNKVLIENNIFLNMSMATIYLSNDSDEWYESGPIRDMTIRNNTFYIKSIGRTSWEYAPAVYFHPVTKGGGLPSQDNPIHKNITIEDNTFFMDVDTVVKAESVENLTIRNNKVWRTDPDVVIELETNKNELDIGESQQLKIQTNGDSHTRPQDNVFEFTKCKNVVLEGNTYDDGLKKYAVLSGMDESNLTNHDKDIKVVNNRNEAVSNPVGVINYASSNPAVASVDNNGKIIANKQGKTEIYAYYVWNNTIIKSNAIEITVSSNQIPKETIEIQNNQPIILNQKEQQIKVTATTNSSSKIEWEILDFLNNENSSVATVDDDGVITAKKNGIVWLKAKIGTSEDKIPVIVSLPVVEGLSPAFSVIRESKGNYELTKTDLTIDLQKGDLYQSDNTVNNLFLYSIPQDIDKNNLRTIVKVTNMPIRENSQWDTASFILYKNDDNYITIGKKSHYNGISSVSETNGAAVETGGNSQQDNVATAYLGFSKNGNSVSLDFKVEGGSWQHLRDIDGSMLGANYKIGFAGWETNDRNKKINFSDFKVAENTISYEELEKQNSVLWGEYENTAPTINNVRFEKDSYNVGDLVKIKYDLNDSDGEGNSLYLWTYYQDGKLKQEVTDIPQFRVNYAGQLKCEVYPKDSNGTPGISKSVQIEVDKNTIDYSLDELSINGNNLLKDDLNQRVFDVYLPVDLSKVDLSYHAIMIDEGSTEVRINDKPVTDKLTNVDKVVLDIKDGDIVIVKRDGIVYQINIHTIKSNETTTNSISMPEIGFNITDFSTDNWVINTTQQSSQIQINVGDNIGKVELKSDSYRKPISLTKENNLYQANINFNNGLNTYYIIVTAKDGITTKQYIVNVIYQADYNILVNDIKINDISLSNFSNDVYEYVLDIEEDTQALKVAVDYDGETKIAVNNDTLEGNTIVSSDLKDGINDVYVMVTAYDGITKKVYHIQVIKPYAQNTEVLKIELDNREIKDKFDEQGNLETIVSNDQVVLDIACQDSQALIEISSGKEKFEKTGEIIQSINIYKESPVIDIVITSRDGNHKKKYHLDLQKATYLSDLTWNEGATVGYGEIQKDKASSGSAIRLPDENGNPVTFDKGIGTHAQSVISYDVEGKGYQRLQGYVGIDYAKFNDGYDGVQFEIYGDDTKLFDSGVMLSKTPMKYFDVAIGDAKVITLKALQGNNNWSDHSDWADIKFTSEFMTAPVKYYNQTIMPSENGIITSSIQDDLIEENTSVTYTFTPNDGYYLKEAKINGNVVSLDNNQYTINDVQENIIVEAVFEKNNFETNKIALSIAIDMANAVTQEQLGKLVPAVADEFK